MKNNKQKSIIGWFFVNLGFEFAVKFGDEDSKERNGIIALNFHSKGNISMKAVENMKKVIGCFVFWYHNKGVVNIMVGSCLLVLVYIHWST